MDDDLERGSCSHGLQTAWTPQVSGPRPSLQNRHVETGCGRAAWEMSQGMHGVSAGLVPRRPWEHPAPPAPLTSVCTQPSPFQLPHGGHGPGGSPQALSSAFPGLNARPCSARGGADLLQIPCFQGNEVIKNSPVMLQGTKGFFHPCSSCERPDPPPGPPNLPNPRSQQMSTAGLWCPV